MFLKSDFFEEILKVNNHRDGILRIGLSKEEHRAS